MKIMKLNTLDIMKRVSIILLNEESFITYCTLNETGYVCPSLIILAVAYWITKTGL